MPTARNLHPAPLRLAATAVAALSCVLWPSGLASTSAHAAGRQAQVHRTVAESDVWLVPVPGGLPAFGGAIADLGAGRAAAALAVFARSVSHPILGGYARLYQGRAELALERHRAALASARHVIATTPGGALGESALWLMADAAEAAESWPEAIHALQALASLASVNPPLVHLRLGRAAGKAGDDAAARRAFATVYYEYPLSAEAAEVESQLGTGLTLASTAATELARAERLFAGRRFADARKAYDRLADATSAEDRALVALRKAECDFHLRRHDAARSALRAYLDREATHLVEAQYFHLSAVRALGRSAEYLPLVRGFVDQHPTERLAETALNDLATYHILANDDAAAADVFDEMLRRFPAGEFGARAAWRAGWWAYRNGDYDKTIRTFDAASVTFPRADYRPSWLYWSARAHERQGRTTEALAGYRRAVAFYRNSFYGRQAARRADDVAARQRGAASALTAVAVAQPPIQVAPVPPLPADRRRLLQELLASGLYDDAILELRKLQETVGSSPFIEATIAYALNRKGELRPAITAMRRAYPQFMAEGGERLPTGLLKVIFPVEHWDLIRRHAAARRLDPFLVAALVAQESTFQADVRSTANAWGLMQIIPATGRRYASRLGIPRFSTRRLTEPEVNLRIGTTHFAELIERYSGDLAHALAAYNAGENRVDRWRAERPDFERDEFIDDIPFPETQNYVKRVLGTAEDYRLLYGASGTSAGLAGRP
jgi:soluble lytic murein transglycosylase